MLGKLSKYSFLLGTSVLLFQIITGNLNEKLMIFYIICLIISMLAFFGWLFGGPIVVVVKDDKDR